MTTGEVKSNEKTQKATESSSPTHAFARQPGPGVSHTAFDPPMIPQMAGNLAVQQLFRAGAIQAKLAQGPELAMAPPPSAGEQLEQPVRSNMERTLGYDFSRVRVYADEHAEAAARALNTRAFTVGSNVFFNRGQVTARSGVGQHLLAHELTHVAQNERSTSAPVQLVSGAEDPAEVEAAQVAAAVGGARTGASVAAESPSALVQREPPTPATIAAASGKPDPNTPAAPKAPDAGADVVTFNGRRFSTSPDFNRFQLQQFIVETEKGEEKAKQLVREFTGSVEQLRLDIEQERKSGADRRKPGGQDVAGAPRDIGAMETDRQTRSHIASVLQQVLDKLVAENATFIRTFETASIKIMGELMDESEKQAKKELEHYGITSQKVGSATQYRGANNAASGDLRSAARELARKHHELSTAKQQLFVLETRKKNAEVDPERSKWDPKDAQSLQDAANTVGRVDMELQQLRFDRERDFPLLAGYADSASALEGLANTHANVFAQYLGQDIGGKLDNIKQVRAGIGTTYSVWTLPKIADLAKKQVPGVQGNPYYTRLVDDKVRTEKESKELATDILDGLSWMFLILTVIPVTAPIGAVGLAATGAINVVTTLHDYQINAAASGTAFDKAQAISAESPSEFWLAAQIALFIPDIRQALKAFRTLAPAARAMLLTKDATEFTVAAARELPEHADKLVARAKQQAAASGPIIGPTAGSAARRASLLSEIKTNLKNYWARLTGGKISAVNEAVSVPNMATARVVYENMLAKTPGREAGIWHNPLTGEIVVVQGEGNWVGGAVNTPNSTELWIIIEHFHPERNFAVQFASEADWLVLLWGHGGIQNVKQRVQSTIRYVNPVTGKPHFSYFGYDPHLVNSPVGPYFLNIETNTGARVDLSFNTFAEYRKQLNRLQPGMAVPQ